MTAERGRMAAGVATIAMVTVLNAAYTALVALFGYDAVLREAPSVVLARFAAAGPWLVPAWAAFAGGALAFAWVGPMIERGAGLPHPSWLAPAAALSQCVGLSRWVTALPSLAAAHQSAGSSDATRQAAELSYRMLHQFAGVGIGEVLGQVLLCAWTARVGLALRRQGYVWLAFWGLATVPLWIAGLTEPLATAMPGLPVVPASPVAFMAWEAWLLVLGLLWAGGPLVRRGRATPADTMARE